MKASGTSSRTTIPRSSDRASGSSPRPDRFRLLGPTIPLDPRIHAYRADIADVGLAGRLFAPHYASPQAGTCVRQTSLFAAPDTASTAISELLAGEPFALLEVSGEWAWGYADLDGYVGYVPADAIGPFAPVSHVVHARGAPLFARPDIKAPVRGHWPMGTRFDAAEEAEGFLQTSFGFVHHRHARAIDRPADDPPHVAERLIGTPYLWGGRSGSGIDCSGLVQLSLQLSGHISVARDSDQQAISLGEALPDDEPLQRGDLVFFPGHVGLMADGETLLHANAFWMEVVAEPLADVIARLRPSTAEPVTARRRLA